tara:strand:+ start:1870 stop:2781 length:912 start_codon:yes stop_codon:yes gene_type:complete
MRKKIILLFGPTASGKSKLAINIAKKFNCEILNADSMQVYKEIKILSARPNNKTIRHHLYGFISAKKNFSVGNWYKLAHKKISEINKRGKVALVVGGTGLYFRALTHGLVDMPEIKKIDYSKMNEVVRKLMIDSYQKKIPTIFDGINKSDIQRVSRALAVYKQTGMTLKSWQKKENKKYFKSSEFLKICILPPKKNLELIIKKRFEKMLKNGAIKEVKKYKKEFLNSGASLSANNIIGIHEIGLYLQKLISLSEVKNRILIRTRQYAKRQYTWHRGKMKNWKVFKDTNFNDLQKKITSFLSKT